MNTELDKRINALWRKLDAMKAAKQDSNDNKEYMETLYAVRDACRERNAVFQYSTVTVQS